MHYQYTPQSVCSKQIEFDIHENVITNIRFVGGCPGNLNALCKILDGWTVEQIENMLLGNPCGKRTTSCADQLAKAVREAYERLTP